MATAVLLFNVPSLRQGAVPQTPRRPTAPDFRGSGSLPELLCPSKVSQGQACELLHALVHRARRGSSPNQGTSYHFRV